ncbi:E3 ubiquitin-protein ligase MBR1-like [Lycium barbarum]|uniref:E3 ubiquitin-protein ligase MBR1-like n=1 Tax=Lycium barbarum TaxID=112863 RepID=UPI00293E956D|nr:E3 ubiquitin-protein ligase MBR1-like [Lycium barbarum]
MVFPSVVVDNHSRYYPVPHYELIDDIYVANDLTELIGNRRRFRQQVGSLYDYVSHLMDDMDIRDEENGDDNDVSKYLKIRTHSSPAKDGVDPHVVADSESEICAICQSEFEHEESIGTLQCEHKYHTDCIKQWLLRKKNCPMCRASVIPSGEQRL